MSNVHDFIMKKGTSSSITTFLLGFFFFLFLIIFHSTLSLAAEESSLFIQTNTPGATVYLDDNQIGKADSKGGFLIDNIPPGTYKITVEMEGYKKAERTFKIKGGGLTDQTNINLQSSTPPPVEAKVPEKKKEPPQKPTEPVPVRKPPVSPPRGSSKGNGKRGDGETKS